MDHLTNRQLEQYDKMDAKTRRFYENYWGLQGYPLLVDEDGKLWEASDNEWVPATWDKSWES